MPKYALLLAMCLFAFKVSTAQRLIVPGDVRLPQDSVLSQKLLASLYDFLTQRNQPNAANPLIAPAYLPETSAWLDELQGIEQNAKLQKADFYKPYLTNCIPTDSTHFKLQLAYLGTVNNQPLLRASLSLRAMLQGGRFYFYSPMKENTRNWKSTRLGYINFYYKENLQTDDAKRYQQAVSAYDKKLKAPAEPIRVYYCDDFNDVQHVLGIDYKLDYNGIKFNNLTARENKTTLVVNGWNALEHRFDPHDLWHERLRTVMSSEVINRPVDEGCAYLYGGSWGYSSAEVMAKFAAYARAHPDADWLDLYLKGTNYESGAKSLKIAYALNALIVQQLEKDKGFDAVKQLLSCGKKQPGDDNYFAALQKLTGITRSAFNTAMKKLIAQA